MDQDNNVQSAGLDTAAEEMPYSEDALSDDVQLADAGEIETDGVDMDFDSNVFDMF